MLDFGRLNTPTHHGDTLVMPSPRDMAAAVHANRQRFESEHPQLLGKSLRYWRRRARRHLLFTLRQRPHIAPFTPGQGNKYACGEPDESLPFVVTGHQPGFNHPGVWAKHIVTARLAGAIGGLAVNLVVDQDAPQATLLRVPALDIERDELRLRQIAFAQACPGCAYEELAPWTADGLANFQRHLRDAMASRYDASQWPTFIEAVALATDPAGVPAPDWVDQAIAGRRAVEAAFGIALQDIRVRDLWLSPLLIDLLLRPADFAQAYNEALHAYRRAHHVRGEDRPIPDLKTLDASPAFIELPLWAYRPGEPRRRLFVRHAGSVVELAAPDASPFAQMPLGSLTSSMEGANGEAHARDRLAPENLNGYRIRPRALALTLATRLLVADYFIHGIGGAKYDRISDTIMRDYYGVEPPDMACVSATLHLDLPRWPDHQQPADLDTIRSLRRLARDLRYNPQRHIQLASVQSEEQEACRKLLDGRRAAVESSAQLRRQSHKAHKRRREAFQTIREANDALQQFVSPLQAEVAAQIRRATEFARRNRIAADREYFFGMYDHARLQALADALPAAGVFRL